MIHAAVLVRAELFFQSLFELADHWCPDIDANQYASFLEKAFRRMTVKVKRLASGSVVSQSLSLLAVFASRSLIGGARCLLSLHCTAAHQAVAARQGRHEHHIAAERLRLGQLGRCWCDPLSRAARALRFDSPSGCCVLSCLRRLLHTASYADRELSDDEDMDNAYYELASIDDTVNWDPADPAAAEPAAVAGAAAGARGDSKTAVVAPAASAVAGAAALVPKRPAQPPPGMP